MTMRQSVTVSNRSPLPPGESRPDCCAIGAASKYCAQCDTTKLLSDFPRNRAAKDGYDWSCKACHAQWRKDNRHLMLEYRRRERVRHAAKIKCRCITTHAIRTGELVPEPCVVCGTTEKIEAHHPDYTKPLEVIWLCSEHHRAVDHGYLQLENTTSRMAV